MAKTYPFKYRFENPGIKPLYDSLWFESHQELLLRIVNTRQGRDLLCIDKSFDGMPIVGFAKNRVTGFLGFEGENIKLVSDFRVGAKWANVIRHRWRDFQTLAREHYSDKVNWQTEILLDGQYRMAATTSTFFPNADGDPSPTTVDGYVFKNDSSDWDTTHNAATGAAANSVLTFLNVNADWRTTPAFRIDRSFALFDTSAIPDSDNIQSATLDGYVTQIDNTDDGNDYVNIVQSSPASNTALITADYNQCGSVHSPATGATALDVGDDITLNVYNSWTLNSTGRGWIDKSGVTKIGIRMGNDLGDSAIPSGGPGQILNRIFITAADNPGTSQDVRLVVVHSEAAISAPSMLSLLGVGHG